VPFQPVHWLSACFPSAVLSPIPSHSLLFSFCFSLSARLFLSNYSRNFPARKKSIKKATEIR
jgi:hypothetical protein